jgi:hypothetical protein
VTDAARSAPAALAQQTIGSVIGELVRKQPKRKDIEFKVIAHGARSTRDKSKQGGLERTPRQLIPRSGRRSAFDIIPRNARFAFDIIPCSGGFAFEVIPRSGSRSAFDIVPRSARFAFDIIPHIARAMFEVIPHIARFAFDIIPRGGGFAFEVIPRSGSRSAVDGGR